MGSNTSLSEFDDGLNPVVVAYYFELARFSVFEDGTSKQATGWQGYVKYEKPTEDDYLQSGVTEHRIRNVTPLKRGGGDDEDPLGFEFSYVTMDGEVTQTLGIPDPRGSDQIIRCSPLVEIE